MDLTRTESAKQSRIGGSMKRFCIIDILLAVIFTFAWLFLPAGAQSTSNPNPYRLRATLSDTGGKALLDSPYHYEAGRGVESYSEGHLEDAEAHFRTAGKLASANAKLDAETRATLECNLGAVLRDEHKYDEAKQHFELAVSIVRKELRKRQPVLDYIGNQYSILLRKTHHNLEADMVREAAKIGFAINDIPLASNTSTSDSLISNRAPQEKGVGKVEMVQYTLSFEPCSPTMASRIAPRILEHIERVSGNVDFYFYSDFRPVHVVMKTLPNTPLTPSGGRLTETYNSPSWAHPITETTSMETPCDLQPFSYTTTCKFAGHRVWSDYEFSNPDDAPANTGMGRRGDGTYGYRAGTSRFE